jgi:hypothetical protein
MNVGGWFFIFYGVLWVKNGGGWALHLPKWVCFTSVLSLFRKRVNLMGGGEQYANCDYWGRECGATAGTAAL